VERKNGREENTLRDKEEWKRMEMSKGIRKNGRERK
jgi:hypothetical protein